MLRRLALLLTCLVAMPAHAAQYAGRRVSDVLDELRSGGLAIIYNMQMIASDLKVEREPQATAGVELAREILAAHGLTLLPVAENTFSVVRQSPPVTTPTSRGATPSPTLDEVVVHTSRYALANDGGGHTLLTQEQMNNLPRLGDETLSAVHRLPGAAVNGWSAVGPIRGGVPNETGIFLDGMRLYEPFHLKDFLSPISVLDARLIDSMEVFSGGFSSQYGDRMSAIIDAKSVHPSAPSYYELGLTLFHLNGLLSMHSEQNTVRVLASGRRSNLSELAQLSEHDFGRPSYSDGFARIEYDINSATRSSLSVLFSSDEISARKDAGEQAARADYRNKYLWGTLAHDWSAQSTTQLLVGFTEVSNSRSGEINQPARRTGTVTDSRRFQVFNAGVDHQMRTDLLGAPIEQRIGIEVRELSANYHYASDISFFPDFPFPGSPAVQTQQSLAPQPHGDEFGAYWDGRIELNSHWAVNTGLRFDKQGYHGEVDAAQLSPRVSVLFKPVDSTRLRASWGRFFQSQAINELQVEDGIDYFYPAQRAEHQILSVEQSLSPGYELRLELYRKLYDRVQPRYENVFDPLSLLPEVEFDRVMIAPSSAQAKGAELLLTVRPQSAWSGWLGYTWSQVEDRIDDLNVPRSWDQTHAINVGIAWRHGPWAVTLTDLYHSGWPTTTIQMSPQPAIGARNAERLRYFNSVDMRISRSFELSRGVLDVFVEASNLTSRQNECCTEYSVTQNSGGGIALTSQTQYWLPLTPSAGILWRY